MATVAVTPPPMNKMLASLKRPSFTACYEWKLPSLTSDYIESLTRGFIQQASRHNTCTLYIPQDIIQICASYYYDINILQRVKTAVNGVGFKSNLFTVGPFKFYMDIFPNGYDADSTGNMDWFLNLSSISPSIHKVTFRYKIAIPEINHQYTNTARLNHDELSVGWDEIKINQLETTHKITFVLLIMIYDIFDQHDKSIMAEYQHLFISKTLNDLPLSQQMILETNTDFHKSELYQTYFIQTADVCYASMPSECGSWIVSKDQLHVIKHSKNGEKHESDIFIANGFKWSLRMYANGTGPSDKGRVDLGIYLVTLSPNISKLWIQYRIFLHETGTYREDTVGFARRAMGYLFVTPLSFEDVRKMDILSFNAEIVVFDVYDKDGNIINNYTNMHNLSLDNMKTSQYEWKPDAITIQNIKRAQPAAMFLSDFFVLHGFKWFLELYPKGQVSTENNNENDVNLYLTLLSIPPNLSSVSLSFELCLLEKNARYGAFEQMGSKCMSYGWPGNILKASHLSELHDMTFVVRITLIDVYDHTGFAVHRNQSVEESKEELKHEERSISGAITLPIANYEWCISDEMFMNKIKSAKNADYFPSNIFMLHSLKWVMQICPNGSSPSRSGYFNWYLHLASLSTKISKLYIFYRILLVETQSLYEYRTIFQCRQPGKGWGNDKLLFPDACKLDTFTFKLEIMMIDVFDAHGNKINDEYKEYESRTRDKQICDSFEWKIDQELMHKIKIGANGTRFESKMFVLCGFQWNLEIYPFGTNKEDVDEVKIHIKLANLPQTVSGISCHFQLFVAETNTIYSDFAHFKREFLFDGWQSSRIKAEKIENLETLSIKVIMDVVDVYDADGMPVTDEYVENVDMFLCDTYDLD